MMSRIGILRNERWTGRFLGAMDVVLCHDSVDSSVLSSELGKSENVLKPMAKRKTKRKQKQLDFGLGKENRKTNLCSAKRIRCSVEGCSETREVAGVNCVHTKSDSVPTAVPLPLSDGTGKALDDQNIKRLLEIEKELILAIEAREIDSDQIGHNLSGVEARPLCLSSDTNAATDIFDAGPNTALLRNETDYCDSDRQKEAEKLKLLLWDELFGFVPDSEDGKGNSEKLLCVEESSTVIGNPCTVTTNQATNSADDREIVNVPHVAISTNLERESRLTAAKKSEEKTNLFGKHGRPSRKDVFPADISADDKELPPKEFPKFACFTVEEEEGSGGYGIVYRARRMKDGATVAIKCPYAHAHKSSVSNELRMLQRFGGNDFVIKYEGRLKNNNLDCLVLEYVEHDQPEILKREIDVTQIRWYGYCLFKALAGLHKHGIVHRDVKPGNFLFSRKTNRGYLIDFNLAMDLDSNLHHKYGIPNNTTSDLETLPKHKPLQSSKRSFPVKTSDGERGGLTARDIEKVVTEARRTANSGGNGVRGKEADGSVVTQSNDRRREPLPSRGRKALVSFLQGTMRSPSNQASSLRKRVPAPSRTLRGLMDPTPMPTDATGSTLIDPKRKKEGPCAGTKGFRAPEVLLRSRHQGTKLDVWSAGVTLLYLITGRPPFYGDPKQNMKEIVRLRGSEDVWELSKLHDRESAFPAELYGRGYLGRVSLLEWCKVNTRRRDFVAQIPPSLVDLVDKCLTVNPRVRISAEEALSHDFLSPCRQRS